MTDDTKQLYGCSECGHIRPEHEIDGNPVFEACHECGASGNHKGYYLVWTCPNCDRQYIGSRPTAGAGGVRGCNRCFTTVPETHLRDAIERDDASLLERFLPPDT